MLEVVSIRDMHHVNVARIEAEAFYAPQPLIHQKHLIPSEPLRAMTPTWEAGNFARREISIDKLFDVMVTEEGLVVTFDKKIVAETITQHSEAETRRGWERVQAAHLPRTVETPCLLMRKRGDHNYGHWLVEILPKLSIARQHCDVAGLAVPQIVGPMLETLTGTLELADPDHSPRFELGNNEVVYFKELIVVSGATQHGAYMSPTVVKELECLTGKFLGTPGDKVYIARPGAHRCLAGEKELEKLLIDIGFRIVSPEGLSFLDQVRALRSATTVVGVMGAGMTNMVFAKKHAKIINLTPAAMPDVFFYFLAAHRQQTYHELRGVNTLAAETSWNDEFHVSADDILTLL